MSNRTLKDGIVKYFAQFPGRVFTTKEVSRALGVRDPDAYQGLREALAQLHAEKKIRRVQGNRYGSLLASERLVGRLSVTRQGGIVKSKEVGEIVFIPPRFLGTALDGDLVTVSLFANPALSRARHRGDAGGKRFEGEIVDILERGRDLIVGRLEKSRNFYFVVPDDSRVSRDIYVPKQSLHGARRGDKVVAAFERWESVHLNPEGRVVEVLGKAGEAKVEVLSVAKSFNLSLEFPRSVLKEAEGIPESIPAEELKRRLDLRELACFTIDPADAKDFDDAVSLERISETLYRLGVHIADVTYFVKEESLLDQEALKRGTSVYLVDQVIPMLPEKLSSNLCSLRPREDRLAFTVLMTVTDNGEVQEYELRESIIRSKRRFTYEEVQKTLDEGKGDYASELQRMYELARRLTEKRMKEGSIDFETPEIKVRLDDGGKPVEIIKKARLASHRLVEEFMLLANRVVAQHIGLYRKEDTIRPFIYRIHDSPDPSKVRDLARFVGQFGYTLNVNGGASSKALQKLLVSVRGTLEEDVINEVALRSMAKAVYSETNIGHYGLGFKYYTHFTSPIRRYPDLVVHRLLKEYERGMKYRRRAQWQEELPDICDHSSGRERIAMEAERESVKVMQVEYMRRHLGDSFSAIVSGVTNFGLFVELHEILVEGLVRIRDLEDDYYIFDEKNYSLIGKRHGRRYRLGDKVLVQVVSVDPEEREIDCVLVKS